MAWFIKTETLSPGFLALSGPERGALLQEHRAWGAALQATGVAIASGFLVDAQRHPGGGGLLVLQAASYNEALALIRQDPLIAAGWVTWQLHEWIAATGDLAVNAETRA
ncbi:MAG: YciI family protein [Prochlorococcaceae cyanobacterium]